MANPVQIVPEVVVPPSGAQGGYATAVSTEAIGSYAGSKPIAALVVGNGPEGAHGAFSFGFGGEDKNGSNGIQTAYSVGVGMKSGVATSNTFKAACAGMAGFVARSDTTDLSDTSTVQQSTHVELDFPDSSLNPERMTVRFLRNNYTPQPPPQDPLPTPNFLVIPFYGDGVRVKTGKATCPTSGTSTVTGLGFKPDLIWFISADKDFVDSSGPLHAAYYCGDHAFMSYGFADIQGSSASPTISNRLMSFAETDNVDPTTAGSYHSDDYCCVRAVSTSSGAIAQPFSVTAVSDDGFTITVGASGVDTYEYAYMALSLNDCQRTVGNTNNGIQTPAGTGQQNYTDLDITLNPQGIIALLGQMTPFDAGRINNQAATFGVGAGHKRFSDPDAAFPYFLSGAFQNQASLTVQTDDAASSAALTYNTRSDTAMFHVPKGVFTGGVPDAGVSGEWIADSAQDYTSVDWSANWSATINNRLYPFIMFGGSATSLTIDPVSVTASVVAGFTGAGMWGGALNQLVTASTIEVAAATYSSVVVDNEQIVANVSVTASAQSTSEEIVYPATADTLTVQLNALEIDADWDQLSSITFVLSVTAAPISVVTEGGASDEEYDLSGVSVAFAALDTDLSVVVSAARDAATLAVSLAPQGATCIKGDVLEVEAVSAVASIAGDVDVYAPPVQYININDLFDRTVYADAIAGLDVTQVINYDLDIGLIQVMATPLSVATTGGITNPMSGAAVAAAPRAEAVTASAPSAIVKAGRPRTERIKAEASSG